MSEARQVENWEAALDALMAIASDPPPANIQEIAQRIELAAPLGLQVKAFPWVKYGLERIYIHVLGENGDVIANKNIFWQDGELVWKYPPNVLPEWFKLVRGAIMSVA